MTSLYCLNMSFVITFIDCNWLLKKAQTKKILKIATSLKVRNIKISKYKLDKFVSISLYFSYTNTKNKLIYTYIYQELNMVKDLKINLLVNNNIFAIERVIIDLANKTVMISSC